MATQSVVRSTGQNWKLVISVIAMLVGSFAPIWPETGLDWWTGSILAVVGYAYGCLAIRCPACDSRWFWKAAIDAGVYPKLFRASACPDCGKDFAGPTGRDG